MGQLYKSKAGEPLIRHGLTPEQVNDARSSAFSLVGNGEDFDSREFLGRPYLAWRRDPEMARRLNDALYSPHVPS